MTIAALGPATSSAINAFVTITDPMLYRRVSEEHFDRVSVIADSIDFALIPSSLAAEISSKPTHNSDPDTSSATTSNNDYATKKNFDGQDVYISADDQLIYARFFADFGPLDLGQSVRFCRDLGLHAHEVQAASPHRRLVVVCNEHPHRRANTMTLLALFLVLHHHCTPEMSFRPFKSLRPPFGFRDAACGLCTYFITILDCARAVHKAITTGIWSLDNFSLADYEHYDQLQNGDINWLLPGKIVAFSGPQLERVVLDEAGHTTLLAADYAKVFHRLGVTCVVRFNEPSTYDKRAFIQANIRHIDMHYPDGGNPTDEIMFKFINTVHREPGAVAVHCKAGLGRTGTNIAAYLMAKYQFTAAEAMAWCRICRPGSIVGPQQQFLVVKQPQLWAYGQTHLSSGPIEQATATKHVSTGVQSKPTKQAFQAMLDRLPQPSTNCTGTRPGSSNRSGPSTISASRAREGEATERRRVVANRRVSRLVMS